MKTSEIVIELREIRRDLHMLKQELQRYKGFAGGVVWCLSSVAAVVGFVWGVLWADVR